VGNGPQLVGSTNLTCIRTDSIDNQECTLSHEALKADVSDAVEDPMACHTTWRFTFLMMAACCFAGSTVFYFYGNGNDITGKVWHPPRQHP
jgi:hypothetical protein